MATIRATFSTSPAVVGANQTFNVTWTDTVGYTFLAGATYRLRTRVPPSSSTLTDIATFVPSVNTPNVITFTNVPGLAEENYNLSVRSLSLTPEYAAIASNNPFVVTCFVEGTEILCVNDQGEEEYIKVEDMKYGMMAKTYLHGAKKLIGIDKRIYKNDKSISQICKISGLSGQTKDLLLTGGHAILVDELTQEQREKSKPYNTLERPIDNKNLLLCYINEKAEKLDDEETRNIYHIVLENDNEKGQYGVYANGVLAETMSIDCYNDLNCTLKVTSSNYIL